VFFVGLNPDNHVPLGNGRVLAWLDQYDGYRHIDRMIQVFYPDYDLSSGVLGADGASLVVKDHREKIWYDPYGVVRERSGQLGEVISIDETRFVEGTGVYEVISHKGNTVVRSTTWVPRGVDAVVRRYEVATLKGNPTVVSLYPLVHLQNVARHMAHVYLSRISEQVWMALTCTAAIDSGAGRIGDILLQRRLTTGQHGSVPTHVAFRADQEVPAGGYSSPAHLVLAFGPDRARALEELKKVVASDGCLLERTLEEWRQWLKAGAQLESSNRRLEYLWRTSLTLLRMSIQHDGSPVIIGFRPYQGNVWVRDSVWIAATLAMTGHQEEALQIMRRMRTLVKTQADGSFHFSYNCSMELPTDHTVENDTMGLLLYGIWSLYHTSGDAAIVEEFASFLEYCADWIPASIDETGMVRPCAGISEVFGPHLERQFEHMMWTSSLSAFALEKAAEMMAVLGKPEKQRAYLEASQRLVEATVRNTAREGVLYRSLESRRLDASALLFFQQLPLSYYRDLMARTVGAIKSR